MKVGLYPTIRYHRSARSGLSLGIAGSGKLPTYSASKGAFHTLTKTLSQMLLEHGIRVNCIAPGPVWTPLNVADKGRTEEEVAKFGEKAPIGRPHNPRKQPPCELLHSPTDLLSSLEMFRDGRQRLAS